MRRDYVTARQPCQPVPSGHRLFKVERISKPQPSRSARGKPRVNQVYFRHSALVSRSESVTLTGFAGFEMRFSASSTLRTGVLVAVQE